MSPDMIALWYKENGYNFLCFSEHNLLQNKLQRYESAGERTNLTPERLQEMRKKLGDDWVETDVNETRMRLKTHDELSARFNEPGRFLLMTGEEITAPNNLPHLNVINLREEIPPSTGSVIEVIQQGLDTIQEQSLRLGIPMPLILNHPNWGRAVTAEEMLALRGLKAFEVYNGQAGTLSNGDREASLPPTERLWDIVLSMKQKSEPGEPLFGYASDDSHDFYQWGTNKANPGRGWIVVQADQLDANTLAKSMLIGDFYSSTGVKLSDIEHGNNYLKITIQQEKGISYTVKFIGTRRDFDRKSKPILDKNGNAKRATQVYSEEIGRILLQTSKNPAVYVFQGNEIYVRATITSDKLHLNPSYPGEKEKAWVQPVMLYEP